VIESWDVSKTSTLLEVKRAVQPWSQSWPMEMSDPEARDGKMWADPACGGSDGRGRVAVWLEVIDPWLGTRTEMPGSAIYLLMQCTAGVRK